MRERKWNLILAAIVVFSSFIMTPLAFGSQNPQNLADIIVIGGGGAGLSAATYASSNGASVIVLEKMPFVGGSSAMCGGSLAFAGTDLQKNGNINDSKELLYKDLMNVGQQVNDPVQVQAYVDNQLETYYWLKELGVSFREKVGIAGGMSVPRSHEVEPAKVIKILYDKAKENGAIVLTDVQALRLEKEQSTGKMSYVLAKRRGKEEVFTAKKAIILASGGFSLNKALLAKFVPDMAKASAIVGLGSHGDGLKMAWAHGADIKDMPYIKATMGLHTEGKTIKDLGLIFYTGAILVNKNGMRFVNESISYKLLGDACLQQPGAMAFQIYDTTIRQQAMGGTFTPIEYFEQNQMVFDGMTLVELAKKIGVPPPALENTVRTYNAGVDKGEDSAFGRTTLVSSHGKAVKIEKPPFYAFPSTAVILGTYGGILIDGNARVLDVFGETIPGLYAAGEVTGGVHGAAYMSGTAFGKAVIFGRLAAKSILSESR
jgi:fumarate reductase flavoprotein subunit